LVYVRVTVVWVHNIPLVSRVEISLLKLSVDSVVVVGTVELGEGDSISLEDVVVPSMMASDVDSVAMREDCVIVSLVARVDVVVPGSSSEDSAVVLESVDTSVVLC
jgi:hypothetical protein